MRNRRIQPAVAAVFGALVLSWLSVVAQQQAEEPPPMGFFITSAGLGDGANLGGLDGADAHCQTLAAAVSAGNRTWRAYLSTQGPGAVNARDRIGEGPWANAEGLVMAGGRRARLERDRQPPDSGPNLSARGAVPPVRKEARTPMA